MPSISNLLNLRQHNLSKTCTSQVIHSVGTKTGEQGISEAVQRGPTRLPIEPRDCELVAPNIGKNGDQRISEAVQRGQVFSRKGAVLETPLAAVLEPSTSEAMLLHTGEGSKGDNLEEKKLDASNIVVDIHSVPIPASISLGPLGPLGSHNLTHLDRVSHNGSRNSSRESGLGPYIAPSSLSPPPSHMING